MNKYLVLGAIGALVLMGGKKVIDSKSRGIRNNNPGNLVKTKITWKGKVPHTQNTDDRFEQFISPEYGIRAMYIDIKGDIKKGQNTVKKLITAYAPKHENNTAAYIAVVSKAIGKGEDTPLTTNDYFSLIKAIIKHENGEQPYSDDLIKKGIALA